MREEEHVNTPVIVYKVLNMDIFLTKPIALLQNVCINPPESYSLLF